MTATSARVALGVWVKTPGFTPAKTRLARSIGRDDAETFYRLAIDAVAAAVREASRSRPALRPVWIVAEHDPVALEQWAGHGDFMVTSQGEGDLGVRLARVYERLIGDHDAVLFIGADAPQVEAAALADAAATIVEGTSDFLLGPADDGGFWLFGGRRPVPSDTWTSVEYSAEGTMRALARALSAFGDVAFLEGAFDVDTVDDLRRLRDAFGAREDLAGARARLAEWLRARGDAW